MSKAKLVITAIILEGRTQAEVARTYGVSKGWVSKLVTRYRTEGEAAFQPHSRRPNNSPNQTPETTITLITTLRKDLAAAGLDAGPDTIRWHLHTLRINSRMHHIGIGRTHARTHVILLVQDHEVRIVNATTGELLRDLTINPERDYQPQKTEKLSNP